MDEKLESVRGEMSTVSSSLVLSLVLLVGMTDESPS